MAKTAKKATAKTPTAKKTSAKKTSAKKTSAKKTSAKKTSAKKTSAKAPAKPSARERGVTVDAYLAGIPAVHRTIAQHLVTVVQAAAPSATSGIKWGQVVFEHSGPMIWLKAFTKHVGLGFWRGTELPDPKGLLEGDGDRMRHVKVRDGAEIDEPGVRALVRAAVAANKAKGDPSKRR